MGRGCKSAIRSTLNSSDGSIASNMAIVPTNNGAIDAFATDTTQLILDISSYFAPDNKPRDPKGLLRFR